MSNPNNRQQGYRGGPSPDPRLSQYNMRPMSNQPRPQSSGQGQRIQSYNLDQINSGSNRPRPPPHHQQQQRQSQQPFMNQQQQGQNRSSRHISQQQGVMPTPQVYEQQGQQRGSRDIYQSARQSPPQSRMNQGQNMRPMRPPGGNGPNNNQQYGGMPNNGQGPYRRVSMNRSRSLSRPERQRPKTGMIRSPSQQQRIQQQQQQQGRYYGGGPPGGPNGSSPTSGGMRPPRPMPNRLQHQLQQQKMYQQEALLDQSGNLPPQPNNAANSKKAQQEIPEEKVKVLTNWWAWIAFLMTCCIPNWFLRVCLRKRNAMVQQAWREKVKKKFLCVLLAYNQKLIKILIAFFMLYYFTFMWCTCIHHLWFKSHFMSYSRN